MCLLVEWAGSYKALLSRDEEEEEEDDDEKEDADKGIGNELFELKTGC
jgi:hypothetical protein